MNIQPVCYNARMNTEELKELERQMGVKHLQYSEGHGAFWCSFVVEQVAVELPTGLLNCGPQQDCDKCGCAFSAEFEGVICPDCVETL